MEYLQSEAGNAYEKAKKLSLMKLTKLLKDRKYLRRLK